MSDPASRPSEISPQPAESLTPYQETLRDAVLSPDMAERWQIMSWLVRPDGEPVNEAPMEAYFATTRAKAPPNDEITSAAESMTAAHQKETETTRSRELAKRETRFTRDSQNRRSSGQHKDQHNDRDGYFHFLNLLVENQRFAVLTGGSPNTAAVVGVLDQN